MSFTLSRVPLETRRRRLAVRRVEDLTPHYRRVVLEGGDLDGFASPGADDHVRIFFPGPGEPLPALLEGVELVSREFTPAAFDADSLAFDFVLHGAGPASEWAAAARPGDEVVVGGPRGSMAFDGRPDWWHLAGDLTALPAIRRFVADLPAGTPVDVVLCAEDEADRQPIESAADLVVAWVSTQAEIVPALARVRAHRGDGFAFVAAEQGIVAAARELLLSRGVDLERAVVKGYWRRSEDAVA